jgi:hypothetical protein
MSISRRKFLQAGTIVAISAGIPIKAFASASSSGNSKFFPGLASSALPSSMDSELFSRYLNTQFTLRRGKTEAKFTLVEVRHWTSLGSKKSPDGKECFSLIFDKAGYDRLPQDTYTATHSALGEFPLFLGPLGKVPVGKQQKKYEALFNRMHG